MKPRKKLRNYLSYFIFLIFILFLIFLFIQYGDIFWGEDNVREIISDSGVYGPLVLIGFQLFQTIIPFMPGGIITLTGGYLFGVALGTLYSFIGLVIGSIIVFNISRKFGRPLVESKMNKKLLKSTNRLCEKYGTGFLFCTRVIPFFPHDLISYAVGSSNIGRKKFILATALGFLPHSFVHNYIGDSVYQGNFGIGFYLVLGAFVLGGFILVFKNQIFERLLKRKG